MAWSLKDQHPGPALQVRLAESAFRLAYRHTLYTRAEHARKDELFDETSLVHCGAMRVAKPRLGYRYELPVGRDDVRLAPGALASGYAWPARVEAEYSHNGGSQRPAQRPADLRRSTFAAIRARPAVAIASSAGIGMMGPST